MPNTKKQEVYLQKCATTTCLVFMKSLRNSVWKFDFIICFFARSQVKQKV